MWLVWPDKQPTYTGWAPGISKQDVKSGELDHVTDNGGPVRPYRCPGANAAQETATSKLLTNIKTVLDLGKRPDVKCAPFDTISSAHVIYEAPKPDVYGNAGPAAPSVRSWRSQFSGRVVMYGFNLQGFQDVIQPPTIDTAVAGVYLHAMALENLLTKGTGYLSDRIAVNNDSLSGLLKNAGLNIEWVEFGTLTVVFGFRLIVMWLMRQFWPLNVKSEKKVKTVDLLEYFQARFEMTSQFIKNIPKSLKKAESQAVLKRNIFVVFLLFVDAFVVIGIIVFSAFYVEYHYLALAPANWLGILGLAFLTYPVFVAALFRDVGRKKN